MKIISKSKFLFSFEIHSFPESDQILGWPKIKIFFYLNLWIYLLQIQPSVSGKIRTKKMPNCWWWWWWQQPTSFIKRKDVYLDQFASRKKLISHRGIEIIKIQGVFPIQFVCMLVAKWWYKNSSPKWLLIIIICLRIWWYPLDGWMDGWMDANSDDGLIVFLVLILFVV